jgi:hypothetical protein
VSFFNRVFYIGPLSCAPLLIATLNFYSSSVLPNASSFCSAIRLVAVSVHSNVPYRAGPLQNSTLTCAAASPLPPNDRLQLSLSLVRLAACFSHRRTRRGAWRTDRRRGRRLLHRRGNLRLQRLGSSHVGGSSKPNPSNPELQFHRKLLRGGALPGGKKPGPAAAPCSNSTARTCYCPVLQFHRKDLLLSRASGHMLLRGGALPGGKKPAAAGREESASSSPARRPASSTAWQQPRRGELQSESLQSRAPIPPQAASWGRPAGREEARNCCCPVLQFHRKDLLRPRAPIPPDPEALLALQSTCSCSNS